MKNYKQLLLIIKNVGEIRHLGLINAIELVKDKDTKEAFEQQKTSWLSKYIKMPSKKVCYFAL